LNHRAKENQKKARKRILALLKKLKKVYDVYDDLDTANEIINEIRSILNQYGTDLPPNVKQSLDTLTSITDTTPEGIKNFMNLVETTLKTTIQILPNGIPLLALVGIGVGAALAITVAVSILSMVEIYVINKGCQISDTTIQALPIQINVDATSSGTITVSGMGFSHSINVPSHIKKVEFDGTSLLGNNVQFDLGSQKRHELIITC